MKTGKCVFCEAQGYEFYMFFLCPACAAASTIWHDGEQWGGVHVVKDRERGGLAKYACIGDFGSHDEAGVVREKTAMLYYVAHQPPIGD